MTDNTTEYGQPGNNGRIEPIELQVEMQRSYIDYAMTVIVGRALPDVRVLHLLADTGSVTELRPGFAPGMVTALARLELLDAATTAGGHR